MDEIINYHSLAELLDAYYIGKISKGVLKQTLLSLNENINNKYLLYADVNYYAKWPREIIPLLSQDIYAPEKSILPYKTEQIVLHREVIRGCEFVTKVMLTRGRKPIVDTEIFLTNKRKIKSFWFSQVKEFENLLKESEELKVQLIETPLLDLEERPNKVLVMTEKSKILKRFKYLEMD